MAYGIITMRKISGSLGGIENHIYRTHNSRTNPDIDYSRSLDNYSLFDEDARSLNEKFNDRIKDLPGQLTKTGKPRKIQQNAVKICDFVVTISPEKMDTMTKDEQYKYFRKAFNFLRDRYGKDNVVYAQVHVDEANPHLHVGIVPVLKNQKLCARELFTKKEMKSLQADFFAKVAASYGLEPPIGGRRGLETTRFKAQKAMEEAAKHAFYEAAPARVRNYMRGVIKTCVEEDIKTNNEYARAAEATLNYIRTFGDDEWKKDWEYMTEADKDAEKLKKIYRDDY